MTDKNQQLNPQKLTQSHSTFLRRNWLTIIACLLGIGFSYYFYQLSKSEREPIFLIDPIKTIVIDSNSFPRTTLKVIKGNNIPIEGDIISIRFYFWNSGKQPIRRGNILNPLIIYLSDKGGEILDYKLLSLSRKEVINAMIERNELEPKTSLNISFHILEKNDGFTGQIIYSGDPNAKFIMKGVIEDVKEIKTNASLSKIQTYKMIPVRIALPWLGIIFIALLTLAIVFKESTRQRISNFMDKFSEKSLKWTLIIFAFLLLIVPTVIMWTYEYRKLQDEANKNLVSVVPNEIRP